MPIKLFIEDKEYYADLLTKSGASLKLIVQYIAEKRAFSEIDRNPDLNCWRLLHGTLEDAAITQWCKIFGTSGKNAHIHWEEIIKDNERRKKFLKDLCNNIGIEEDDWEEYKKEMQGYRNKHASHTDLDAELSRYPILQIALSSSCYYFDFLKNMGLKSDIPNLKKYYDSCYKQYYEQLKVAVESTKHMKEEVW